MAQKPPQQQPALNLPEELTLQDRVGPLAPAPDAPAGADDEETTGEFLLFTPLEGAARTPWWSYLRHAWRYPFTGTARWMLALWLVCDLLYWIALVPMAEQAELFVVITAIPASLTRFLLLGTLAFYELHLANRSAWDPDQPPALPALQDVYEGVVRPMGLLAAALAVSAAPYLLAAATARVVGPAMPPEWGYVLAAGALLFTILLPANLLAVATADHVRAFHPRHILAAIVRAPGPYLGLWATGALLLGGGHFATAALVRAAHDAVLASLAREVVLVYLLTVWARSLGTFYAVHAERIGWMREPEEE